MAGKSGTVTGTAVRLLGPPRIERDGEPVSVDTRKATALLAYLAMAGRPISRDALAALLWPEADQSRARAALRRTLSALNAALGGRGVRIERESLSIDPDEITVDVVTFRRLAGAEDVDRLRGAADLYGGDLLSGFALRDSVEFDEWQLSATEGLRREFASVLERLSDGLAETDIDEAIAYARRWLELDPLHEAAHRALIRLHTRKGDRTAAVRQYRECVALLERELGVAPGAETTELYETAHGGSRAASDPTKLQELVGDLMTLQGRYAEAERSYETAITLGARPGVLEGKIADVRQRLGDFATADTHYADALNALDPSQHGDRARLLAERSLNALRDGRGDDAHELAAQALDEAKTAGERRALGQAHNINGILASHRGDVANATEHFEASLSVGEELSDAVATAAALNNLALVLKDSDINRALTLAQRALDLCARVGDRHREAAMHSNLADLLRAAGRNDEAMRHLRTSAAIFAEIGESDEPQPEIWKLVEW